MKIVLFYFLLLSSVLLPATAAAEPTSVHEPHIQKLSIERHAYLAFMENLVVSQIAFSFINAVLFRHQLLAGDMGAVHIGMISSIEIAKNLINYVNIEIKSNVIGPVISYAVLNYVRTKFPAQHTSNSIVTIIEFALAEWAKNKVNFEVTENWYPRSWLSAHNDHIPKVT